MHGTPHIKPTAQTPIKKNVVIMEVRKKWKRDVTEMFLFDHVEANHFQCRGESSCGLCQPPPPQKARTLSYVDSKSEY